jgi:hypothetical protein
MADEHGSIFGWFQASNMERWINTSQRKDPRPEEDMCDLQFL